MNLHCKPQSPFPLAILHNFKGNIVLIQSNYNDISIDPLKVNFVIRKETSRVILPHFSLSSLRQALNILVRPYPRGSQ